MPYGCTIYVITTWVLVRRVHENKSPSISLYLVNREIKLPRIKFGFQYIVLIQRLILSFTSAICILASPKISIVPRIMSRETLFPMFFFRFTYARRNVASYRASLCSIRMHHFHVFVIHFCIARKFYSQKFKTLRRKMTIFYCKTQLFYMNLLCYN